MNRRDPERIKHVVAALYKYWQQYPDLRLAQIIGNAAGSMLQLRDPYPMEDDVLMRYLLARTRDDS